MASQVTAHKDVLDVIDNQLLPSAKNVEVKTMLGETRRQVAAHLTRAEDVAKKLGAASAAHREDDTERSKRAPAKKR